MTRQSSPKRSASRESRRPDSTAESRGGARLASDFIAAVVPKPSRTKGTCQRRKTARREPPAASAYFLAAFFTVFLADFFATFFATFFFAAFFLATVKPPKKQNWERAPRSHSRHKAGDSRRIAPKQGSRILTLASRRHEAEATHAAMDFLTNVLRACLPSQDGSKGEGLQGPNYLDVIGL